MLNSVQDFLEKKRGDVDEYKKKIEEMLEDPEKYDWAEETLTGIYDYCIERDSITDGQKKAVDNIRKSVYARRY